MGSADWVTPHWRDVGKTGFHVLGFRREAVTENSL
jgi:hypothetical protein